MAFINKSSHWPLTGNKGKRNPILKQIPTLDREVFEPNK